MSGRHSAPGHNDHDDDLDDDLDDLDDVDAPGDLDHHVEHDHDNRNDHGDHGDQGDKGVAGELEGHDRLTAGAGAGPDSVPVEASLVASAAVHDADRQTSAAPAGIRVPEAVEPTAPTSAVGVVAGEIPAVGDHVDTIVPGSPAETAAAAAAAAEGGRMARRRAVEEAARESALTSRRRALIVSGIVLGLLVGLVVVWAVTSRSGGDPQPPQSLPATPTGPIQPTLLFQLKSEDGIAVGNSLLSVGGRTGRATDISIPPSVIVEVATGGALPFGEIVRLTDQSSSANALSDAMGVNVNATQWMDPLAFSGLVDAVGGVIVDVDVDVLKTQPDGTKVVLIPAGNAQTLQGPQAALFATYLAPGEPEEVRMARFTQVFRLVLSRLPSDPAKVEPILTGLGASARSTVPASQIAAFLVRLHSDVLSDNVAYKNLPVKSDQVVAAATRIDQEATAALVTELLPDAARTPGPNSKVRVLVQNGVGAPGLNAAARQLIVDAGYTYVNGGNAAAWGQKASVVVVPDATRESLRWGNELAAALKIPATAVQVATSTQTVADVIVVLGADFTPAA
jgi:anionic cell wall polymer biosynthesis LytR-Cps2A-Psr (LCP) family protein